MFVSMVLISDFGLICSSENGYASTDEEVSEFSQASESGGYDYFPHHHTLYHEIIDHGFNLNITARLSATVSPK